MIGNCGRLEQVASLLNNWWPVALWGAIISYFSTEHFSSSATSGIIRLLASWLSPTITWQTLDRINFIVRKSAHWTEYFIFAILLLRALAPADDKGWRWRWAVWTLIAVLIYASGDELHQALVPGRSPHLRDVLLDFFGGTCGVFWMYRRRKRPALG